MTREQIQLAVRSVQESKGFEPVNMDFYEVEAAAIEQGYIYRKPADQYGVTAKGRKAAA